jgi:hypothetical protein
MIIGYFLGDFMNIPVYVLPILVIFLGIIIVLISFMIGGFEGMGLGALGLVLLVSSIVAFVLMVFWSAFCDKNK